MSRASFCFERLPASGLGAGQNIPAQSQSLWIFGVDGQNLVQPRLCFRQSVGCNQSLDLGECRLQFTCGSDTVTAAGASLLSRSALSRGRLAVGWIELEQPVVNVPGLFEPVLGGQVPGLVEQSGNFLLTLSLAQQGLGFGIRRLARQLSWRSRSIALSYCFCSISDRAEASCASTSGSELKLCRKTKKATISNATTIAAPAQSQTREGRGRGSGGTAWVEGLSARRPGAVVQRRPCEPKAQSQRAPEASGQGPGNHRGSGGAGWA